jgi:sugar lactone lactonase YvrE
MRISVVADVKPLLGESPLWDPEAERLYFIDALGRRVFRCTEAGAEFRAWTVPSRIGSLALRQSGGAVVALRDGFHALDFDSGEVTPLCIPETWDTTVALNDGKVDHQGRFWCGSMDLGESAATGTLWRLDADLGAMRMADGIVCSNGPAWAPDGRTFYFADSFQGIIWAFDSDPATGRIANRRDFAKVPADRGGAPDGATVDSEGCLWSATVFDGRIRRYAPDGRVDRVIEMPVCKITSLAFGGPSLDRLFVTSMAEPPLPKYPGDGPMRGSVFVIDGLGVTGLPEPRFAG